ncbi:ABC transporter permease [Anaeromyxobacter diazotrophicus]|uniref:Transport permease protein n=1 Tax=Anaeromyxobacter diazotrophicus TaxID=2590199 RepID=A0A7I9VSU7_9BACT|nr:ABC transporter permease [Anaeromyxobacter diazotrophicus]GEJ59007.1 transport permease protein [Anaeromyxobacter diazotrophicus]
MTPARAGGRGTALVQYRAVVRKEALQTLRDRRIMFMLVAAPLIQTILFGFAVDFDVDHVPAAVADLDRSAESREELRRLLADGTLRRVEDAASGVEADRLIDQDRAAAAVVIPPGFGGDLAAGRAARLQVVIDGTDPIRAGATLSAAGRFFAGRAQALAKERLAARGQAALPELSVSPRVLYNPRLKTAVYMVPGILAMLLVIVTTIVTAMGLSREREMGTLEQVLVTPVKPLVLLLGKMTPFVFIGLFDVLLVVTAMTWIFAVPLRGPLAALGFGTVLYLCSTLGVGLFISTVSANQQQSFLGGFLFVLPAVLLSGIMTPIRAMPAWLQAGTWLNPLRFYAELVRGVLLRGAGFADLAPQLAALAVYGVATLGLATLRFRRRLG